jgi:hypothetical protein
VAKGVPERGGARRRRASVGGGAPRPGASAASEWTSARERAGCLPRAAAALACREATRRRAVAGHRRRTGVFVPSSGFLRRGRVGFFGGAPRMALQVFAEMLQSRW